MTSKERISIDAAEWAYDKINVSAYSGYIAGATAERKKAIEDCILKLILQFGELHNKEFSSRGIRKLLEPLRVKEPI